ncbi:MAG: arsenate reductase ArsC [Armatimonadota bacterium]
MKQVLFVCVHNAGRSQMAEAWFNALAPAGLHAVSGGTEPGAVVNPVAIQAMAEIGIDLTAHQPKLATPEMVAASAPIITMGCGVQESCPLYIGMRIDEDWGLDDPAGQPLETVRRIRDEIRLRVIDLIDELKDETHS